MLELAGQPVINREDYNLRDLNEFTPTLGEHVRSAAGSAFDLNPVTQSYHIARLNALGNIGDSYYTDEMGQQQLATRGLAPEDPRARRLSVEEANDRGLDIGLRFSEPPTQGQFDYLADLKKRENSRNEILSHAPTISIRSGMGFAAGLAASAIDPLNVASAFVPVVGAARYARMVERIGKHGARAAKGAAEGLVGSALVVPAIYTQAGILQQEYGVHGAMMDLTFGTALGSGLHVAGGAIGDAVRWRANARAARILREADPRPDPPPSAAPGDRRKVRVQEGENASIVEAMPKSDRGKVLDAAVKAVETDVVPKADVLLRSSPELRSLSIPDKRFPATLRMRSDVTASDFAAGNRAVMVFNETASRMARGGGAPALFKHFVKRYKKLNDFSLKVVSKEEFDAQARGGLEHPDQRALVQSGSKTILVAEDAPLGAVRHEIERALDEVYGATGEARGGYRYHHKDIEGQTAHRAALRELYDETPDRAPHTPTPNEVVDLFSKDPEPILGHRGRESSDGHWDTIQDGKDKDLEKRINDEELDAIEDIARAIQNDAATLGVLEKVIPLEERTILDKAVASIEAQKAQKSVIKAVDDAILEREVEADALSDVELLMRAGPIETAKIFLEGKSPAQVVADVKRTQPELVTRAQALKSIALFEKSSDTPLQGVALERAIKQVQAGEDINVAVQGARLLARADEAAEAPAGEAARFEAPGEERAEADDVDADDFWGDIEESAAAILDKTLSKRELGDAEARLVLEEHEALARNPKTEDLASEVEREEFSETQRNRTLREGTGSLTSGERARAGDAGAGRTLEEGLFATRHGRDGEAARGQSVVIERERSAIGGERTAPETAVSYGAGAVPRRVITPDSSIEVSVEPKFVELDDLRHAEGALQVRDRSRKESEAEAFERALKLDPEQLMPNRVADAGAPIVIARPDGTFTIISGNGRVLSLRKVYDDETLGWKANQYRDRLGPAADGYRRPVLVSVITDRLSHEELARFAERANRSRIAQMSITEKAQRDADSAGIDLMMLYQGGDFSKKENQPFLRAFMRKVATPQEMGEMSKNGVLTKTGLDRLNAAVLASAYDDTGVLSLMLESTDNNIKSIASAYRDVAPIFMKLRSEIAQGLVRESMDITAYMMEAARFVQEARDGGVKIANALAQIDAFTPMDPMVDRLIRQFYNPQLTRANSALRISENLRLYAEAAREKRLGGFFEDTTTPLDVMSAAERQFAREASDEAILARDDDDLREGAGETGEEVPQPAPGESGVEPPIRSESGGTETPDRQAAEGPASLASILSRQGEPGLRAHLATFKKLADLRAEAARQKFAHKGRSRQQVEDAIVASVIAAREDRLAAAGGHDPATVTDRSLLDPEERATVARDTGLTDEQIDALPDPEAPAPRSPIHPKREAFYDFLESDKPVKDARTIAKALNIDHGAAFDLLDEAVESGWLKLKDNGTYIRTPKKDRPARPDVDAPIMMLEQTALGKMQSELESFIDSGRRNTWIYGDNDSFSLYVRNSQRPIDGELVKSLDISNVSVKSTGKGSFRQMLEVMEGVAYAKGLDIIYVENVMTDRFADFFRKTPGWEEEPSLYRGEAPNFIKRLASKMDELTSEIGEAVRPPKGWDVIEPEIAAMERDLQVGLSIQRAVGKALHRVPDVIKFQVMDMITAGLGKGSTTAGMFYKNIIHLSKQMSRDPVNVVNHEIFHALRGLRLFTQFEWNILRNAYEAAQGIPRETQTKYRAYWVEEYRKIGIGENDPRIADKLIEEWAATDLGHWSQKRASERETPVGMLYGRVKDFLHDLKGAFENLARRAVGMEEKFTSHDIFRAIEDGTIAKRWEEWGMGRKDGSNPLSTKSMAIDEHVDMLNATMRAIAKDDSMAKAAKQEEVARAFAPCVSHHL